MKCETCQGTGLVNQRGVIESDEGDCYEVVISDACPDCQGRGEPAAIEEMDFSEFPF